MVDCMNKTTGASSYTTAGKGQHGENVVCIEPRKARAHQVLQMDSNDLRLPGCIQPVLYQKRLVDMDASPT
jgi:hypothetical protein